MLAAIEQVERASPAPQGYWALSRGPLASLMFIAPLLVVYEAGVLGLGSHAVRNGADVWLRGLLDVLGFGQYFLLPGLTVVLLLCWHHLCGQPWRLPVRVMPGMVVESISLGLCLVLLAQLHTVACHSVGIVPTLSTAAREGETGTRVIAFLGAGIYEEALFRLMLLPPMLFALSRLGVSRTASLIAAVVVTSLIFSLAHYVGPTGDRWQSYSFLFRLAAGGFFAVLFVYRGFGIAAGTHAAYDILVGLG